MEEPVVAQKSPFAVEAEKGKKYAWRRCGRSTTQPYCDGSRKGTGLTPIVFTAERTDTLYLCGCKKTGDQPFSDGTHATF